MMARPVVVLVEDQRDMAQMVESVVEQLDSADVVVAEDIDQALALIRESNPALVIVDDDSPRDSVRGVMARLGADAEMQFTPVAALTLEPERVLDLTRLGVVAFLKKPFDVVDLVNLVELCTQPSRSRRLGKREAA